jgi:hypothetical protein
MKQTGLFLTAVVGIIAILALVLLTSGFEIGLSEDDITGQAMGNGWNSPRMTLGFGSDGGDDTCNVALCEQCIGEAMEDAQDFCDGKNYGSCYTNTYEAFAEDCQETGEVNSDCKIEDWWSGDTPDPTCKSKLAEAQRGGGNKIQLRRG